MPDASSCVMVSERELCFTRTTMLKFHSQWSSNFVQAQKAFEDVPLTMIPAKEQHQIMDSFLGFRIAASLKLNDALLSHSRQASEIFKGFGSILLMNCYSYS